MSLHTVFVYGTLMRNQPNHHVLGKSEFLGEASTVERRALVVASRFNIPFLLHKSGDEMAKDKLVCGELYRVDDDHLAKLDQLENVPRLYWRRSILVKNLSNDEVMEALTYVLPNFRPELADLPRLSKFDAEQLEELGTPYVKPGDRGDNSSFLKEVRTD